MSCTFQKTRHPHLGKFQWSSNVWSLIHMNPFRTHRFYLIEVLHCPICFGYQLQTRMTWWDGKVRQCEWGSKCQGEIRSRVIGQVMRTQEPSALLNVSRGRSKQRCSRSDDHLRKGGLSTACVHVRRKAQVSPRIFKFSKCCNVKLETQENFRTSALMSFVSISYPSESFAHFTTILTPVDRLSIERRS